MSEFPNDFVLEKLDVLNCHTSLKYLLENSDDDLACNQLRTAAELVQEVPTKQLLPLLLPENRLNESFLSSMPASKSKNITSLASELLHAVQVSKANQAGFIYSEKKKKHCFNANLFAEYFLSRTNVKVDEYGMLFAYNNEGFYKSLSDVAMGRLVRKLMNEGLPNSWKVRYEKEAIDAIKRECFIENRMDNVHDYINMKNGMYSLKTGKVEPHHPKFLSTVQIPVQYDANATCPRFMKFMCEITCGDTELMAVLQEMIGYLLGSEVKCEKAFYFTGWGANGKSVLANVISILVGKQNISSISLSQFSSDFGLEGIVGKKVNIAPENEMRGLPLNTEVFKAMVSGDGITINLKHRPALTNYKPECKFLFLTNQLPNTQDHSEGGKIMPYFIIGTVVGVLSCLVTDTVGKANSNNKR